MCSSCHWKGYNRDFCEWDHSLCLLSWLFLTGQSGESSLGLISEAQLEQVTMNQDVTTDSFRGLEAKTKVWEARVPGACMAWG